MNICSRCLSSELESYREFYSFGSCIYRLSTFWLISWLKSATCKATINPFCFLPKCVLLFEPDFCVLHREYLLSINWLVVRSMCLFIYWF